MSTSSRITLAVALSTLLLAGKVALGKPTESRMARVARQALMGAGNRRVPIPHSQTGTNLWGLDVIIQTADGNTDTAPEVGPKCNPIYETEYGCKKNREEGKMDWVYQCKASEADGEAESEPRWTLVQECELGTVCSGSNAATSFECKAA